MFDILFINPIINLLVGIYHLLLLIRVPSTLGVSIILVSIAIRLILYPFTRSYLKASKKMQSLTPHLSRLKERHKGDSKKIQEETMLLYKEHGVNPLAGCLPMLVQIPIAWGLYSVLQKVAQLNAKATLAYVNGAAYGTYFRLNHVWDTIFFGIPLEKTPHQLQASWGVIVFIFPIATAVFQYIQSAMMLPEVVDAAKKELVIKKTIVKKEEVKKDDFASAMQTQSLYLFPIMIGFASFNFPIALSLYWNTFTIFGIMQQYRVSGWGGFSSSLAKLRTMIWKIKK